MPELTQDRRQTDGAVPLRTRGHTEKVSTYMELSLLRFLQKYRDEHGYRSVSEVLRRLVITGAKSEGYKFYDNHGYGFKS